MNITIEKGIEIPSRSLASILEETTPIKDMEVNDSFLYPGEDEALLVSRVAVYSKKKNKLFLTRKVDGGRRVWRIS